MIERQPIAGRSYARTIAIAIAICLAAWIVWNAILMANMVLRISRTGATGFAFVLRGIVEGVVTSLVLGSLVGTAWYFIRRRLP
jgi:hypothetical protein